MPVLEWECYLISSRWRWESRSPASSDTSGWGEEGGRLVAAVSEAEAAHTVSAGGPGQAVLLCVLLR